MESRHGVVKGGSAISPDSSPAEQLWVETLLFAALVKDVGIFAFWEEQKLDLPVFFVSCYSCVARISNPKEGTPVLETQV